MPTIVRPGPRRTVGVVAAFAAIAATVTAVPSTAQAAARAALPAAGSLPAINELRLTWTYP